VGKMLIQDKTAAAWRLFKFPLSGWFPAVTRLALHEEDKQMIYFNTDESAVGQIDSGQAEKSLLTGFFKLNKENAMGFDGKAA
jgi:hypothetical protein